MNPPDPMAGALSRRNFFALAGGAALLTPLARLAAADQPAPPPAAGGAPIDEALGYRPIVTPNGALLPWKRSDGVKVFHLVAEPVTHEFAPGLTAECWGYNGGAPGPTIEAREGDRVRIYVTNRLPEPTTVHWHGLPVPAGMDGVAGVTQKPIAPGETYRYEFVLKTPGTFMYHPHHDEMTQMQLGLMGLFVVHPQRPAAAPPDRDYAILLSEWKIEVGARRPDPAEMTDFNVFTFNGRCFPGTQPLLARTGERVRIRFGNLSSMSHHSIHLHGYHFQVTATDGGEIPAAGQWPETTVLVPTGSTRTIEFTAGEPGDWMLHCHMLHHGMTQMGHHFGNWIGVDSRGLDEKIRALVPGYMAMGTGGMEGMKMPVPANSLPMGGGGAAFGPVAMGGMFTLLKVRDRLEGDGDPGWYRPPAETQAGPASPAELARDGITVGALKPAPAAARPS